MSLVDQNPTFVNLRFPLGFPASGNDHGPPALWVALSSADTFHLDPFRYRTSGNVAEWFLARDRPFHVHIFWRPGGVITGSPLIRLTKPLRLTLGEIARTPDQEQDGFDVDQFALTGGTFEVKIQDTHHTPDFSQLLSRLWPTRAVGDVVKYVFSPAGVHILGELPAPFFPGMDGAGPLPDAERLVVLRLPRDNGDTFSLDGISSRPYWTLGNYPFRRREDAERTFPTAREHISKWVFAFGGFRLDGEQSSIVDSVAPTPENGSSVGVFGRDTVQSVPGITWLGQDIRTRVNLGGGKATEATYRPERIEGRAPLSSTREWVVNLAAGTGPTTSPTSIIVTLPRSGRVPPPDVKASLHPVVSPTVPFTPPASESAANVLPSHRLWLCTTSGWAALDAGAAHAEIEVEPETQGAIAGVIEVDKVVAQLLSDAPANGLRVNARTRASGTVSLRLRGTAARTGSLWRAEELSLTVTDPFLTVTTPAVFYQPPLTQIAADQRLPTPTLPALTSKVSHDVEFTTTDADDIQGILDGLDEAGLTPRNKERAGTKCVVELASAADADAAFAWLTAELEKPETPLTSVRRVAPTPATMVARLGQSLSGERMKSAVFVSDNVTTPADGPNPLVATLTTSRGFVLSFPPSAVTVWHRPDVLPLVRTYPLDPDQDLGGFLDANRGMLPFRPKSGGDVSFRFELRGLPSLDLPRTALEAAPLPLLKTEAVTGRIVLNSAWRLANASGRGGSPAYFLPTVPGLEFDPAAAFVLPPGEPEWVQRHAVPVLDEAYATASEARRDPTTTAQAEPAPPDPGDLPPGFDPTRVVGAEAFRFGPTRPTKALGWLPQADGGSEAQEGSLALRELDASLEGSKPTVKGTLSNPDGSADTPFVFSRDNGPAGLDGVGLRVTLPDATATDLPSFSVGLSPGGAAGDGEYDDLLRNNGVPLLAAVVDNKVLTHDNLGLRHEEPLVPGTARVRRLGDAAPRELSSLRGVLRESGGRTLMQLDLLGVEVGGSSTSGSPRQGWMLHDGAGFVPQLGGFAFRPLRLERFAREGSDGNRVVEILGIIELKQPTNRYAPVHARSQLGLPGVAGVRLTWSQSDGGDWNMTSASGTFDWHFQATGKNDKPEGTRLTATLTGLPEGDAWDCEIRSVELRTANGPLVVDRIDGTGRPLPLAPARLSAGKLEVLAALTVVRPGFEITVEPFTLDRQYFDTPALVADGPNPDWSDTMARDVELKHLLKWTRETGGLKWSLIFANGRADVADGWTVAVETAAATLARTGVAATVAGPGQLVLHSPPTGEADDVGLPDGSWFERKENSRDQVIGGAVFKKADELSALSIHLLISLVPRAAIAGLGGELAARLSLEVTSDRVHQQLTCSGWLRMTNQIPLRDSTAAPVTHTATLVFRNSPWSVDAAFLGVGPERPSDFVLPVEHTLTYKRGTAVWQVVQPVRFCRLRTFAQLYLRASTAAQGLVVDLSWAFWSRPIDPAEQVPGAGSVELASPFLEYQWRFRLRAPARGEFDRRRSFVARLPFGYAGPIMLTNQAVTLGTNQAGNREVASTGAAAGETDAPLFPRVRPNAKPLPLLPAAEIPEFDRSGPNAQWLDPEFLATLFADADAIVTTNSVPLVLPLLPAYAAGRDEPTTKLPAVIGDWAWLLRAIQDQPEDTPMQVPGAALRTPYVPRSTPMPLAGSAMVEIPFWFEKTQTEWKEDVDRVDVQLLGFVRNSLRVFRRGGLEISDDPQQPTRREIALAWARGILDETRRDGAAVAFRDFRVTDPEPDDDEPSPDHHALVVPRPRSASRTDRPRYPTAPLAALPRRDGGLPEYETDARRRSPSPGLVNPDGTAAPIDAQNRPVVFAPTDGSQPVPEYFAFAARPEVPTPNQARGVAATRIRLALSGPRLHDEPVPSLLPARRYLVQVVAESNVLEKGELAGWTKTEDVPFEVAQASSLPFPTPGAAPHSRRDGILRHWNDGDEEARPVVTIVPPLVDIVVWARRPGELTRSLVAGFRAGYPDSTSRDPYETSPAIGQDLSVRRPRARAGPFESVSIEPTVTHTLPGGLFQYSRLRLTQTLDATAPPAPAEAYLVLAGKSEISRSAFSVSDAETAPALLRQRNKRVEPHSLFLVADEGFNPSADFPSSEQMSRTVLIVQRKDSTLPDGEEYDPDPDDPNTIVPDDPTNRVVLLLATQPVVSDDSRAAKWANLFDKTFILETLSESKRDGLAALFTAAIVESHPVYILLATYRRAEDDPAVKWDPPGAPLAVIQIQLLDSKNEFDKPRSSLTLLGAPRTSDAPTPGPESHSFAGYGRLGDDDFQPIRPVPLRPPGAPVRIGWARVAELQSLDRLSDIAPPKNPPDGEAGSAFAFDPVFYGPGGELVPTTGIDSPPP